MFSFGATLYEVYSGELMPSNGQRWHEIRAGEISMKSGEMFEAIVSMVKPSPHERPTASNLLHIRQLKSIALLISLK